MSNYQADDADYMADEYEMEDVDDDMDDEFRGGRDIGGSDSDVDEYDYMVCEIFKFQNFTNEQPYFSLCTCQEHDFHIL